MGLRVAQELRALVVLTEDQVWFPAQSSSQPFITPAPGDPMPSSDPSGH